MPWQRQVLDTALEVDEVSGDLAYRTVVLTVPRQSGKTTLLLVLILLRALGAPGQQIRYTAQTGSDARKKWMDDWLPLLQKSPFASQFRARLTNGHEALIFRNGSHQGLVSTTKKAGHGGSLDLCILDEAFAHPDARLEQALMPAMKTRRSPQMWVVSTAGTPEDSPYLWHKVETGRQMVEAGVTSDVAYFEWSADEKADPASEATWWSCMPALGRTTPLEAIYADLKGMESLSEFKRADLNLWVTAMSDPVIPLERWNALVDEASVPVDPVVFAFDVTPDRAWASIGISSRRPDGLWHVEVVAHRAGTTWVAPRVAELVEKWRPAAVLCDPAGPAGSLMADMASAGVEVTPVSAGELVKACGVLYDAVVQEPASLRHLGTPELAAALDGAVKRELKDAWAWSRKSSSVDISPLVAVTLALWGAQTSPPQYTRVLIPGEAQVESTPAEFAGVGERGPKFRVLTQEETTVLRVPPR